MPYPGKPFHENSVLGSEELDLLRDTCAEHLESEAGEELYGLVRGLLDVEQRYRTMTKRKGLYAELESVLAFYQFDDEADAQRAIERRSKKKSEQLAQLEVEAPAQKGAATSRQLHGEKKAQSHKHQTELPYEGLKA